MFKELIDQYFIENQKHRDQMHFYITDAGKCPRQVFFKFKNAPKAEMDARIMRIFEAGDVFHRHIFNILYRIKDIGVTTEISIPAQELISGRADAIISYNKENYILDIKTMNSMIFKTLNAPKEENVYQLQLYLHFFRIQKGVLLYIDKDRQEMKEFFVEYDSELCDKLLVGFTSLKDKIDASELPERLPDYPKGWQCQYCQFKEVCKNENGKIYEVEQYQTIITEGITDSGTKTKARSKHKGNG